jgi:hypothetical protein
MSHVDAIVRRLFCDSAVGKIILCSFLLLLLPGRFPARYGEYGHLFFSHHIFLCCVASKKSLLSAENHARK